MPPLPALFLLLSLAAAGPAAAGRTADLIYVQRKPYDRGNCFHWPGCRGESLGAMWVPAPNFCAALGGRSWLDEETGRCHDLPPVPRGLLGL